MTALASQSRFEAKGDHVGTEPDAHQLWTRGLGDLCFSITVLGVPVAYAIPGAPHSLDSLGAARPLIAEPVTSVLG